jgi:hypothetical protein
VNAKFDWQDSILRNLDDIFTYIPTVIFLRAGYTSLSHPISTEHAYKFKTNNFGLVQAKDLARGVMSRERKFLSIARISEFALCSQRLERSG